MRRYEVVGGYLFCLVMLAAPYMFMVAQAGDKPRRPAAKIESSISDMHSRSMTHLWPTNSAVARITIIPTADHNDNEATLTIVEFQDGKIGLYNAMEKPENDAWLLINQIDLHVLGETVTRAKSR